MTTSNDDTQQRDPLLQSLKIKHLTLKNRIMSTSQIGEFGTLLVALQEDPDTASVLSQK